MAPFVDHYYVVKDLQVRGALGLTEYSSLTEALEAYKQLPSNKMKALGAQNTMPLPGSLDFIQCRAGQDTLVKDYKRIEVWDNPQVQNLVARLRMELKPYEVPESRFIDSRYNLLFTIPDGERVVITSFDGRKSAHICKAIDPYHMVIEGFTATHICELAERCQRGGTTYAPESPRPRDILDTYEIFQIENTRDCEYAFRDFENAAPHIRASDYKRTYAGVLAPNVTLNTIWETHNMDERPFGQRMRSLSISDIVVTHRGGKSTAYYVEGAGFKELPGMAEKLAAVPNMPQPQFRAHRRHREER